MRAFPAILLSLIFLAACDEREAASDIAGTYRFEGKGETQEIAVEEGGRYVNSYFRDGALIWRDEGVWEHDEAGNEKGITFEEFRFGLDDHSPRHSDFGLKDNFPRRGYWFVVPERSFLGSARLCFDPDLDHCFERG